MGRVKSLVIKKVTRKLLEEYPDLFGDSFEENKKIVAKILPDLDKKRRNSIAGYITRLKKRETKKATRE